MPRYWHHPESDCYFAAPEDDDSPFDDGCDELSRAEYAEGLERQAFESGE